MSSLPESLLSVGGIRAWSIGNVFQNQPFDARDPRDLDRLSGWLGLDTPFRQATQIHGDQVDLEGTENACDAFLVKLGQAALVRHADCFPVVVAAPRESLAILAHCGWKGTRLGLATKSVRQLEAMGCRSEELFAAIGPGIGPDHFEVGPEVLEQFPIPFHAQTSWGTPSVDLPAFLLSQLIQSGLRSDQITCSKADTFADPSFHSYRREKEVAGRNASVCIVSVPLSNGDAQS